VSPPVTRARFRRYLAACARPDFVGFLIRRRSDDAILGSLELGYIVRGGFQSVYLGYQIGAPFARQGYMKEAVTLAIRHAFRTLKLHRIEANIQPTNRASIALVKQLGFRKEGYSRRYLKISGRWRDHERWAILREDWTRSR
jgi:[ribosomal protein S5]-alanine N-acetyltransferase